MNSYFPIVDEYIKQLAKAQEESQNGCNGDAFLFQIGKFNSIRGVLLEVYRELCKQGLCVAIEDLDREEKLKLWEEAKRISEKKEVNYVKNVCRALHGFGSYIIAKNENQL